MKHLVTGGAGFIGSHLVDALLARGDEVVVVDDLSSGSEGNLSAATGAVEFVKGDVLDTKLMRKALQGVGQVHHLAANPDVRLATEEPEMDLRRGALATFKLLEAMRAAKVRRIAYASSSTVYGEATVLPTPEDYGPLLPASVYGAGKLACEGMLAAHAASFGFTVHIFRFANIIGPRGAHGILTDFLAKLAKDPKELEILGDGKQEKSYMLVGECVDAWLHCVEHATGPVNVVNLGSGDQVDVSRIAEVVCKERGLSGVRFRYTGGVRGWPGDVPRMFLATERLGKLGWGPATTSEDAIRTSVRALLS
ncbi:MAG: NAD-dependent epimerase/dehydratase family protein [Methanobacteriota archaeon]